MSRAGRPGRSLGTVSAKTDLNVAARRGRDFCGYDMVCYQIAQACMYARCLGFALCGTSPNMILNWRLHSACHVSPAQHDPVFRELRRGTSRVSPQKFLNLSKLRQNSAPSTFLLLLKTRTLPPFRASPSPSSRPWPGSDGPGQTRVSPGKPG